MKLVECVPNFSEGRDPDKIRAITREIETTPGVKLLDVDPGASTNRTVVTFIGTPEAASEAAFRAMAKAAEVIDMRSHKGAHSRIGATDVCPFIPLTGTTMEDCAGLARALGRRVADELGIPVYLYEEAATTPERRNLAAIRQGEYEGLAKKLRDPVWKPDFGKPVFNARAGATVIGAREFLIAYNINLNTRDRKLASEIALNIRESGRVRRDADGNILRDASGEVLKTAGRFPHVKAVGWYIEDYGLAQISINFTNYQITPIHAVFDEVCAQADRLGLRVTGSELVGLIPRRALLDAGRHYLRKQGKSAGAPEKELIRQAVLSLGLNDLSPFDPKKKVIEFHVEEEAAPLVGLDLLSFADEVSMDSPAPGGGSVAALCGALGAALSAMVANLTVGKKGYEAAWEDMDRTAVRAQDLKDRLLLAVDRDTTAFKKVLEALRLPKSTPEQLRDREAVLEAANREATAVPLGVLRDSLAVLDLAGTAAARGNANSVSDAGVAALAARAAAEGAYYNVLINLPNIGDASFRAATKKEAVLIRRRVLLRSAEVQKKVDKIIRKI